MIILEEYSTDSLSEQNNFTNAAQNPYNAEIFLYKPWSFSIDKIIGFSS